MELFNKRIIKVLLAVVLTFSIMPMSVLATEIVASALKDNSVTTSLGTTKSEYLQQLPENISGCTNLYESLSPVKGYYTATKYDTSNGAVLSVVIPVEAGDRIAASSFGSVSENMGAVNGIRVTYLLGDEIVTSLSAGEVYNGYTSNGYITVPDGVDSVCVPWWKPSDSNWLTLRQISKNFTDHSPKTVSAQTPTCTEYGYTAGEICEICNASLNGRKEISPTGHTYIGNTCTVCGAVNLLTILDGKYVSVLGDSISTFNGYSNDATVNSTILGNAPRYDAGTADTKPSSYCLLESVDQTWWMHFANRSGMKLLVNNSWAGSQVFGEQTSDGRVIPAAYLDRCVNLHDNTLENNPGNTAVYPDVIFVYLGINDYNFNRNKVGSGAVDYAELVKSDGTYVTPTTFGEAYGIMLHKMQNAYPNAQIFAMTLLPENLYSVNKTIWDQHNTYIRAAAKYYDIPVVDLAENCAITWENYSGYMIDKIHPTTAGMKLISDCIEEELIVYYKENTTHTHTYKNGICTTCGELIGSILTDNEGNQQAFATLQEALNTAQDGQLLTLQKDAITGDFILPSGVDIDLNGHKLTVDSILSYSSSSIIDTSKDACGLLKINDTDGNMISANNVQLPVYDSAEGGYRFFEIDIEACTITGGNKYWFRIKAEKFAPLYDLINKDANVQIKVKMTWDGQLADTCATAELSFTKVWADRYNENADIYITVTVEEPESAENFKLIPMITSGGVDISGEEM